MKNKGFTLVELMIVVSILGILAAIVLPQVQGHTQQAKESAAKSSLRTMRSQIEMYKLEHNNAPGYVSGTPTTIQSFFINQLTGISNAAGGSFASKVPNATYPYGPYLQDIPANPYNGLDTVKVFTADSAFSAVADGTTGWLYKTLTGEIRLNWTGTDSAGVNYYDY